MISFEVARQRRKKVDEHIKRRMSMYTLRCDAGYPPLVLVPRHKGILFSVCYWLAAHFFVRHSHMAVFPAQLGTRISYTK